MRGGIRYLDEGDVVVGLEARVILVDDYALHLAELTATAERRRARFHLHVVRVVYTA